MRSMKRFFTSVMVAVSLLGLGLVVPATVSAAPVDVLNNGACNGNEVCGNDGNTVFKILGNVINLLLVVAGFVSILMIIIGGITYTTSAGDANQTKRGKDTVLYAVIGLIVSIMSFAIVNFVLSKL